MSNSEEAPRRSHRRLGPRAPSRSRGVLRFDALVDATDALLCQQSPEDVGLYQIAERAGVPPASVYHFFPTKEAAFLALVQRYLGEFNELIKEPFPAVELESWQRFMAFDQRRAMNFYNRHPPAMKLLYGGYGSIETRQADIRYTERIAQLIYPRMNHFFHMPYLRKPEEKCHIGLAIVGAVWQISCVSEGRITEEYYSEALAACIAYYRLYLPEMIELRDEFKALAEGDEVFGPRR